MVNGITEYFISNIILGILKPIGRMLSNKAVLFQTVALSLLNTALFGYVNHDTASIQVLIRILLLCTNTYLLPTYELGVSVLTPSAFQVLSEELY